MCLTPNLGYRSTPHPVTANNKTHLSDKLQAANQSTAYTPGVRPAYTYVTFDTLAQHGQNLLAPFHGPGLQLPQMIKRHWLEQGLRLLLQLQLRLSLRASHFSGSSSSLNNPSHCLLNVERARRMHSAKAFYTGGNTLHGQIGA